MPDLEEVEEDVAAGERESGRIRMILRAKGYGFIVSELDGREVYFHAASIEGGRELDDLVVGDLVEYERISHAKGPRALNVRFVEGAVRHIPQKQKKA